MKNIYALGFFDGVHLGHQALLKECVRLAQQTGCQPYALTFDIHPQDLVQGNAPMLINTPADRRLLLEQFGMTGIHTLQFDEKTRQMPWQDFSAI
jgi:riboflavin kinase/FMN adenylyltransferase